MAIYWIVTCIWSSRLDSAKTIQRALSLGVNIKKLPVSVKIVKVEHIYKECFIGALCLCKYYMLLQNFIFVYVILL
jgi:hypothetical protein